MSQTKPESQLVHAFIHLLHLCQEGKGEPPQQGRRQDYSHPCHAGGSRQGGGMHKDTQALGWPITGNLAWLFDSENMHINLLLKQESEACSQWYSLCQCYHNCVSQGNCSHKMLLWMPPTYLGRQVAYTGLRYLCTLFCRVEVPRGKLYWQVKKKYLIIKSLITDVVVQT